MDKERDSEERDMAEQRKVNRERRRRREGTSSPCNHVTSPNGPSTAHPVAHTYQHSHTCSCAVPERAADDERAAASGPWGGVSRGGKVAYAELFAFGAC